MGYKGFYMKPTVRLKKKLIKLGYEPIPKNYVEPDGWSEIDKLKRFLEDNPRKDYVNGHLFTVDKFFRAYFNK